MPTEFEEYFRTVRADLAAQPMAGPDQLRRAGARRTRMRRAGGAAVVAAGVVVLAVGVSQLSGGASSAPQPPGGPTQNTYAPASSPASSATTAGSTPSTPPSTPPGAPFSAYDTGGTAPGTAPTGTPTTSDHPSALPPSTQPASTDPPPCQPAQITVTFGRGSAAAGHEVAPLLFQNTGSTTCRLHGYPTVWAVNAAGKHVFPADQTPRGYAGGLKPGDDTAPSVDVKPGQTASALEEYSSPAISKTIPCATIGTVRALEVLIPGAGRSTTLSWNLAGSCSDDLQIHPIVPGSTGRPGE